MTIKNKYKIKQKLDPERIKEKYRSYGLPDNFCPVPFTTIIAEPDGKIGSCRLKGSSFSIGNINEKSIDEIWNDDFVRKWRREFLSGEVTICEREIKHRGCNLCSENNLLIDDIELSEYQTRPILKFTANFNGLCNLECQMCDIWKKPNGLYDKIEFWDHAEKNIFPYIKRIDFLSGEPFLQKDTFRLIDKISEVNPDCRWLFTTNAHYKFGKKLENYLDKIKIGHLMISLDSMRSKVYEKIRIKGRLDQVLETAEDINNYRHGRAEKGLNHFPIKLGYLIQKDNWADLGLILDYCSKMNFRPYIQYCYEPYQFSILSLDIEEQKKIIDWYLDNLTWQQIEIGIRALTPSLDAFDGLTKAEYLLKLKLKKESEIGEQLFECR
jgi:MoaA/NifB/PqqE/SkfB family radical SAM enzyme